MRTEGLQTDWTGGRDTAHDVTVVITFLPLAAESLGGWHMVAVQQVENLAATLARHTGKKEEEAQRRLFQKLGVLLVKGNCALFTNRISEDSN